MVNLKIRLSKDGAGTPKDSGVVPSPAAPAAPEAPSVPPHLVDADLPLAKGLGTVSSDAAVINLVGVKARRRLGDKVHICVRCNFPIAVYGRLDPCEHVYCLTCAKLDSMCFLCDEKVVRIQKMDVLEGILICGAPGCLRSFLARPDFEWHVTEAHAQLLHPEVNRNKSATKQNLPPTPVPQTQVPQNAVLRPPESPAQAQTQQTASSSVSVPKKEDLQRKPMKTLSLQRQDSQGAKLIRPILELRLPEQYPHLHVGDQQSQQEKGSEVELQLHRDKEREAQQQRQKDRELYNQHRERENDHERAREGQLKWQQEREMGQQQIQRGREREREMQHQQSQGPPQLHSPHPVPHQPPQELQKRQDRLLPTPSNQAPGCLPPPPPYPPPGYPPSFQPQQEGHAFAPRFDSPRFHPYGDPRMPMSQQLPGPPDFQDGGVRPRHPGLPMGLPQEGERPLNVNPQDGFGPMDRQGGHRPHFPGDFGPMVMAMGGPRFQEGGHVGHLPPPPPGPPPKRVKFGPGGPGPDQPLMDYGWGGGNLPNFGGPGGHGFPGWMPPTNA